MTIYLNVLLILIFNDPIYISLFLNKPLQYIGIENTKLFTNIYMYNYSYRETEMDTGISPEHTHFHL